MPTVTLRFTLPEEREDMQMAVHAGRVHAAIYAFDNLLRARVKYGEWGDSRLTAAEGVDVEELITTLRSVLSELMAEATSLECV